MKLIMPMAGEASRFNKGRTEKIIKPLIEINGKKLYEWALISFENQIEEKDIVFIIQKSHLILKNELSEKFPAAVIVELDQPTRGPGESLTYAKFYLDESPLIVCDCDLYFKSESFLSFMQKPDNSIRFGLLTFLSDSDKYSYVLEENGRIKKIAEKNVISNNAVCGCYYFSSGESFKIWLQEANKAIKNREIYLSDVINFALFSDNGGKTFACDFHVSLGTPEEIEANCHRLPLTTPDKS